VRSLPFFVWLVVCSSSYADMSDVVVGACVIRAGMVTKLAEVKQERNTALLKAIEKEGTISRLSEPLQSESRALAPSSPFLRIYHNFSFSFAFQKPRPSRSSCRYPGSRT
jgi:hypothetical protein